MVSAVVSLNSIKKTTTPSPGVASTEKPSQDPNLQVLGQTIDEKYKVYSSGPIAGENLSLHANFKEKETAKDLFQSKQCKSLINAGYYTDRNLPVAMFKGTNSEVLRTFRKSLLSDVVFSLNYAFTPRLTRQAPKDPLVFAVQVGPMLWENGSKINLKLKSDSYDRRMVVVVDGLNRVYFLAITDLKNSYSGPKLADLPDILGKWAFQKNIVLADASNLDGGSASSYISDEISLTEITPVGAILCAK